MNISDEMRLAIRRQLDAEDDMRQASETLDKAHLEVAAQADKEGLFSRDIEAMFEQVKQKETDELFRNV